MTINANREMTKTDCQAMFPYLISITDKDSGEVYRYANTDFDIETDIKGETCTFEGKAFSVVPSEKSDNKIGNGSLIIYDAAIEWIPRIRSKSVANRYELEFISVIRYLNDGSWELEKIENERYTLSNFSWSDNGEISCTMVYDEDMGILMPMDKLDSVNCPALF